jgi:hypothetical protein
MIVFTKTEVEYYFQMFKSYSKTHAVTTQKTTYLQIALKAENLPSIFSVVQVFDF